MRSCETQSNHRLVGELLVVVVSSQLGEGRTTLDQFEIIFTIEVGYINVLASQL